MGTIQGTVSSAGGSSPTFSARVEYKDFDNNAQTEIINSLIKIYTQEQAIQLGLIKKNRIGIYFGIAIALLFIWFIWRKIKKARKNKMRGRN